jgi:hypothetical protein
VRALLDALESGNRRAAKSMLDRIWPPAKQPNANVRLYFDAQDLDA